SFLFWRCIAAAAFPLLPFSLIASAHQEGIPEKPSFHDDVRPILQAKCLGCHQPAKAKGDYIMTDVAHLLQGGQESEYAPVIHPRDPAKSYFVEVITTQPGEPRPEMPPKGDPLTPRELSLVTRWIEQGAQDDTPENARQRYSAENPPQYAVAPVITSLDYSPDGTWLAVAGFHEVLLHHADGSGLAARLVGISERIESVRFSPDGTLLAVVGGLPGRMGELQVWDVEKRLLKLSLPTGYDTAYGASWSPDGTLIAFGLPDHTVRAVKASNGEQVLFMGSHSDWVLDTTWSKSGDHLVSVGRDMTTKLTEVKTERFVDNLSSITPGALKGGLNRVVRHPLQDHIFVGGSDGVPQIYRMKRETVRKIGDNANLIRRYPAMPGRIWDGAFAPDGKSFVAVSSLNGSGRIDFFASDYDATITPELKKLFETARKNNDPKLIEFQTKGAVRLHEYAVDSAVFSVAFSPDGKTVVAGTADGRLLFLHPDTGKLVRTVQPVALTDPEQLALQAPSAPDSPKNLRSGKASEGEESSIPTNLTFTALEFSSSLQGSVVLRSSQDYAQLLVEAVTGEGQRMDVSRQVTWTWEASQPVPMAAVSATGLLRPTHRESGSGTLTASLWGLQTSLSVTMDLSTAKPTSPDFITDVNPVLTRLGCNMGTCHGAKDGKAGFKLSLRGYDTLYDVRAFGDDHAARRVNFASPDDSLMLLKATGAVPHQGGVLTDIDSDYYRTLRQWIADGAQVDMSSQKVERIELFPKNPVAGLPGSRQQFRVVAHFPNGMSRDVTQEAFIDSGNSEVATHDDFGLLTTIRRGEAPVLARYEGAYAATTLTVMGDREAFVWETPETWGAIDELVSAKWERLKILPSPLATDEGFLRRVHLDLTGLPPSADQVRSFLADKRPPQEKRSAIIDELIGSADFVEHWTNRWADLLQLNSKFLGGEGTRLFRDWIRDHIDSNTPYDQFVREIITASGSNKTNPAASYYKILRNPEDLVENTTHLFLATRFNCNKCHDHPFERWNVDNYYQTAAYFSQVSRTRDKEHAAKANIGGTAVEGAKPLYEVIADASSDGEVTNIVTGQVAQPTFPFPVALAATAIPTEATAAKQSSATAPEAADTPSRREELAEWLTAPDNPLFARSYANRVWAYLTGTGIIEPIDDIRAGNPPTNPELLDHLTHQFVESGFDVRALIREICHSRTYQLSIETHRWNEDDDQNFSHGKARRLPAEVLFDTIYSVTGSTP
ncbi:MAG: DUF1549 domain-containing protein, partial [Verrucomicrobiota bacterium]